MVSEVQAAMRNLAVLGQCWERSLFTTGGALNLLKSVWFALHWEWKGGKAKLILPPPMTTLELSRLQHELASCRSDNAYIKYFTPQISFSFPALTLTKSNAPA
jgi:hypothetical protein